MVDVSEEVSERNPLFKNYNYKSHNGDESHIDMALVGAFHPEELSDPKDIKTKTIYVYGEKRPVPHFHFYRGKDLSAGGCIVLNDAMCFPHDKHTDKLDKKEIEELLNFLDSTDSDFGMSMWKMILMIWNLQNPDSKISMDIPIPLYHADMPSHEE